MEHIQLYTKLIMHVCDLEILESKNDKSSDKIISMH